jgi:hypothetical protein
MVDVKYPVSGSIRVWWTPTNGFANWKAPTVAELTASMDISDSISWNDKDFGVQASNTVSDPAITATGNAQTRGAAQYGGSFSFYYPKIFNDASNLYSLVYDALRLPNTEGYITVRVDGLALDQATGTAAGPGRNPEAGDLVNVFKVATAGYAEAITGEEAFRYTVSFLPRGQVQTFGVVRTSSTAVAPIVTGATTLTIVAKYTQLDATVQGRKYTRGVVWSTTTPALASISANGVVKALAAGAASFLATDPATNTPSTAKTITIS